MSHVQKVDVCSSCAQPVHVSVCNQPVDREYSETLWCVAGAPAVRISQWIDGTQSISWQNTAGSIIAPTVAQLAGATPGACLSARDFEFACFTTPAGVVTPVRVNQVVTNGVVTVTYTNQLTGAVYVPAATDVFGTDCPKYDWETVVLCDNRTNPNTPFMRHMARLDINGVSTVVGSWDSGIGSFAAQPTVPPQNSVQCDDIDFTDELGCAAGVPYVRRTFVQGSTTLTVAYINSAGATVAAPAGWTLGSCAQDAEIVTDLACAAGVQVLRTQTFTNGVLTATSWTGANGATIAAPATYTWGQCAGASSSPDVETLLLCDNNGPFLQVTSYLAGVPTVTNRNLTNTAAYVPVGTVGACDDVDIERETICYQTAVNAAVVSVVRVSTYRDGALIATAWFNTVTGAAAVAPPAGSTVVDCPVQARTQTQSIIESGTGVGANVAVGAGFGGYSATLVWTLTTAPPNAGRGIYGTAGGVGVPLGYTASVEADENWTIANNLTYQVSIAGAKWVIVRRTA